MKIISLYLENFRGYSDPIRIEFSDLTCLVGKNDAGKSTIMEALDFFFNEGGVNGVVKLDKNDVSIGTDKEEIVMEVTFTDLPKKVILDATVETSLKEEFLLNKENNLQVRKIIGSNGKVKSTRLIANYPKGVDNVHGMKISQLKTLADSLGLVVEDRRVASILRKKILNCYNTYEKEEIEIETKSESGKAIWEELKKYLPVYSLFQSDRKNQDKDGEVQDPMKEAVKETLAGIDIQKQLQVISDTVIEAVQDVAERTLEKLTEMNPEIAKELKAEIPKQIEWEKVFNFELKSDDGIPLNKRGSGVRRMILLNFFRAQAEKRTQEVGAPNVIYAFEEPETAQHPDFQRKLVDAFIEISKSSKTQVLFTTHSPELCTLIPTESLRLIDKSKGIYFNIPTDEVLKDIADALGVLPSISLDENKNLRKVNLAVCVEGKLDITFLKNINCYIPELKEIIDLNDDRIITIPLGGSTLKDWVNEQYLQKLELNQFHLYDSDKGSNAPNKYSSQVRTLNQQKNCKALETELREIENYVHPTIFENKGINFTDQQLKEWNSLDVGECCARKIHEQSIDTDRIWQDVSEKKRKEKISKVKNRINQEYSKLMTKDLLEDLKVYSEVENWFISMKELLN